MKRTVVYLWIAIVFGNPGLIAGPSSSSEKVDPKPQAMFIPGPLNQSAGTATIQSLLDAEYKPEAQARVFENQGNALAGASGLNFSWSKTIKDKMPRVSDSRHGEVSRGLQEEKRAVDQAPTQEHISDADRNWYQWRGPLMTGEAPHANPPLRWSETKNVKWKTKLGGRGHSTPIVTNDSVYLTLAREIGKKFPPRPDTAPGAHDNKLVSSKFEFVAVAIDRATGKIKWQKVLHSAIPHEGAHISASLASASPVTDGQSIWFFFGTYGLYCLNPAGETLWSKNLGVMNSKHGHGEGASPVLHGNTLAINWDHEGQSFVAAFDKQTGDEIWRKDRDEITSWASPIVVEHGGRTQLIVAGTNRIRAYDLKNGDVIWQCGGMSHNIVATPVHEQGLVFFGSSYEKRQMLAIKLAGANGDITSTDNVVWSRNARTPYVPSLLVYRGYLYFLRHYQGILSRLETRNGIEPSGPFRLGSMNEIYASPVAAAGKIYVTDRKGTTAVISADKPMEDVIVNRLNDRVNASAAISKDEIFLRGEKAIYCIKRMENELP